jgi:hypothetical protein
VNSGKGTVDVTIVGTGSYDKKYYAGTKTVTLKVPVK